jgi:hypothetical protein
MVMICQGRSTSLFEASQQWSTMLSYDVKTRLESQLSRMNCQMSRPGSLGTFCRQSDDADVFGHDELSGNVPPLIHQYDRVSAWGDGERYLGQVQRHGFGIAEG